MNFYCLGDTNTLSEVEIVAITILAEARGEGESGMYAVGCVIQQRKNNSNISATDVCLKRKQFSCWNKNDPQYSNIEKLLLTPQAKYAKLIAEAVIDDGLDLTYTGNATHYHSRNIYPYWANKEKQTAKIGNHIFYKLSMTATLKG